MARRILVLLVALSAVMIASLGGGASAQELPSLPALGVPDPATSVPPVPITVSEQLKAAGENIDALKQRHPWMANPNAPLPLGYTYVQGSWANSNGSSTIVYCLIDVAAEHPHYRQRDMRTTDVHGGVRCNERLDGMTGSVRARSWPDRNELVSAGFNAQHQVTEGWQAWAMPRFVRSSTSSNQEINVQVRLQFPDVAGKTGKGWNGAGPMCTKESQWIATCNFTGPPFQTLPYPCPGNGLADAELGLQPGACVEQPKVCPLPSAGIQPNCVSPPGTPQAVTDLQNDVNYGSVPGEMHEPGTLGFEGDGAAGDGTDVVPEGDETVSARRTPPGHEEDYPYCQGHNGNLPAGQNCIYSPPLGKVHYNKAYRIGSQKSSPVCERIYSHRRRQFFSSNCGNASGAGAYVEGNWDDKWPRGQGCGDRYGYNLYCTLVVSVKNNHATARRVVKGYVETFVIE